MRPASHWRGFWATILVIMSSLRGKLEGRQWLKQISRQRQQYWWHGFQRQRHVAGAPASLSGLEAKGLIVATHSLSIRYLAILSTSPHRMFAATASPAMS
jgi:hypothetical protein